MSKYIKITSDEINDIKADFLDALRNAKLSSGKFTFTYDVGVSDRRATLIFAQKAWIKQEALVKEFSDEVAWHGIARRLDCDTGDDTYIIDDIMVYPQEVTGATVTTDQEKYQNWLYEQEDDVFNNIRMQGHSHVNMGVSPSTVDESLYERILEQLEDDMFYIFLICNKKGDMTIKIYDLLENILFETKDVDVIIDGFDLGKFVSESKENVTRKQAVSRQYGKNADIDESLTYKSHKKTKKTGGFGYGSFRRW